MKTEVPEAEPGDEYGLHACALMRRMAEMGVDKALEAEIAKPSWDDPHWCRAIVNLVARRTVGA